MNGDRFPREGHAGPTRVEILNARSFATMNGASCGIFRCRCESRKWVALETVRFAHATRQNWQKRGGRLTGLYVFQLSGLVDYQKRCGLIADTWEMT